MVTAAPTVCAAATLPRTPRLTVSTFVDPNPTTPICNISLSIFKRSLVVIEVTPTTLIVVEPIPIASLNEISTFFLKSGDCTIPSIEIITLLSGFIVSRE